MTKIMVVEDEIIVAEDIRRRLQNFGYDVPPTVSSGADAVIKAENERPDLVLMDIVLQNAMDGIEAAEQIHDRLNIPVVYLTAYADERTLERAKRTGPFGYIIKPFEERELRKTIEMALYKYEAERKLKEEKAKTDAIISAIGDPLCVLDTNFKILYQNDAYKNLFGEHLGEQCYTAFHNRNDICEDCPVILSFKDGAVHTKERIMPTKDGAKNLEVNSSPLRDSAGAIIAGIKIVRDITARRKMEEDILRIHKLESIGVLTGGIAHDFNNLLTAIVGNIGLVKMREHVEQEALDRLKEAEKASFRAKELVELLIAFSRGDSLTKKTVHLHELLRYAATLALSGSNVRCEFTMPAGVRPVEVDEKMIWQVIHNMVLNAKEAMPGGGTVKISAQNTVISPDDRVPLPDGEYVKLSLEDHGIGIPEANLHRIFDPYFSTKAMGSKKGVGLGLAVCYSIIKSHGGLITVTSAQDSGAAFDIYLPVSERNLPLQDAPEEKLFIGSGNILVMDDEKIVRDVAGAMLKKIGYEVEFASNGAEAVELYKKSRESGRPFDAVLMDLTVAGGMGGKIAVKKILEFDPGLKAIVSSGYSDDPVLSDCRKYGFCGVITKPYHIQELSKSLYDVITGARRRTPV